MEKSSKKPKHKDPKEMPFLEHLEELRWRIIKCIAAVFVFMLVSFPFSGKLISVLTYPNYRLDNPATINFINPTGAIRVRMEIALAVGLIAALPVILYQFWQFVAPGLLEKERKYIFPTIVITTLCFLTGSAFAYFILLPTVLPFLYKMGTLEIRPELNLPEYMSFTLRLILVAGLIFELPVLSFFLSRMGLLTPDFLKKYRRYGIVLIFIFAALLTPPDPLSQIMMAVPLLFLYQISVWVSIIGRRRRDAKARKWEEDFDSGGEKPRGPGSSGEDAPDTSGRPDKPEPPAGPKKPVNSAGAKRSKRSGKAKGTSRSPDPGSSVNASGRKKHPASSGTKKPARRKPKE
jgi:sec-independent protein translocase protein TatC